MSSSHIALSVPGGRVNGAVRAGDELTIDISSLGGVICHQNGPIQANSKMQIDGRLILNMDYDASTVFFGHIFGEADLDSTPVISRTGRVEITGNGAYDASHFVDFRHIIQNDGTITINNISMFSGSATSVITGRGTLNLIASRLKIDHDAHDSPSIGSITGGQIINMTGSDLSVQTKLSDVTINMKGGHNYLALRGIAEMDHVVVRGFGKGDMINLATGVGANSWSYDAQTGILSLSGHNCTKSIDIGHGYDPSKFAVMPSEHHDMTKVTTTQDVAEAKIHIFQGSLLISSCDSFSGQLTSGQRAVMSSGGVISNASLSSATISSLSGGQIGGTMIVDGYSQISGGTFMSGGTTTLQGHAGI